MRSYRAISNKLKEVKFRYLSEIYKEGLSRNPSNCRYNRKYVFYSAEGKAREIRLCLFDPSDPVNPPAKDEKPKLNVVTADVCEESRSCIKCNAFVLRYSKEELKSMFEEELKVMKIKATKYSDLCALEWVLEKNVLSAEPLGMMESLWIKIKNWRSNEHNEE